jgi:hypothetical protein
VLAPTSKIAGSAAANVWFEEWVVLRRNTGLIAVYTHRGIGDDSWDMHLLNRLLWPQKY